MKTKIIISFLVFLLASCQKASQTPLPSTTHLDALEATPTITLVPKVITESMYMTAVASVAPPQPTPSPFPTLDIIPDREIAYTTWDNNDLYTLDGRGDNDRVTRLSSAILGSIPVWSPDQKYIALDCSYLENEVHVYSLCLFETKYLRAENAEDYVTSIEISKSAEDFTRISSYSWSPDAEMLIVLLGYGELCVITVSTHAVDCSLSNYVLRNFSDGDIQTMLSAASAIWSPRDKNIIDLSCG